MGLEEVLGIALREGGIIDWSTPGRPILKGVHPELAAHLREHREVLREILRRAAVFREQVLLFLRGGGTVPLLALSECPEGGCISCGGALEGNAYRCRPCIVAVEIALKRLGKER